MRKGPRAHGPRGQKPKSSNGTPTWFPLMPTPRPVQGTLEIHIASSRSKGPWDRGKGVGPGPPRYQAYAPSARLQAPTSKATALVHPRRSPPIVQAPLGLLSVLTYRHYRRHAHAVRDRVSHFQLTKYCMIDRSHREHGRKVKRSILLKIKLMEEVEEEVVVES